MQEIGVIQPSISPLASPIVLVRKKDGSLRFCIDYRHLNSVTKLDTYPLPRIDDFLDQLVKSKYFSTLDLASGYWHIPVHPGSGLMSVQIIYRAGRDNANADALPYNPQLPPPREDMHA